MVVRRRHVGERAGRYARRVRHRRRVDLDSYLRGYQADHLLDGRIADGAAVHAFIADLANRLAHRVQLTPDGHKVYVRAVEGALGADVDYAMLVKLYGTPEGQGSERRYSPA